MLDTNADFYVKIRADGTEIRQCRQCAKDRAAILRQRAERHPVVGALLVESAHSWIATLSPEGASTPERGRLVMQPDGTASIVAPRRRQHFSRTDSERPLPDPFEE